MATPWRSGGSSNLELNWDVLLIGGPSGTGKTRVSYPLARHFGIGITEQDDIHVAVEAMTTPEQMPLLHYFRTHPEAQDLEPEQILEVFIGVCRSLTPAFAAVIANHIESRVPIVLEGDYALPEILSPESRQPGAPMERVAAAWLYEPDEGQIKRNLNAREPEHDHTKRARVSWLHGEWLRAECERLGLVALPARPWETVLERVIRAIGSA